MEEKSEVWERGKRRLKGHWVDGVGEAHKKKKTQENYNTKNQTIQTTEALNQTNYQNQSTIKATQENKPHQMAWKKSIKEWVESHTGECGRKEEKWS